MSEVKKITEPEAFQFLHNQAAKERKRPLEVALSICKVYRLIRDQSRPKPKKK